MAVYLSLLSLLLLLLLLQIANKNHTYNKGEAVKLRIKVFHKYFPQQETYELDHWPLCKTTRTAAAALDANATRHGTRHEQQQQQQQHNPLRTTLESRNDWNGWWWWDAQEDPWRSQRSSGSSSTSTIIPFAVSKTESCTCSSITTVGWDSLFWTKTTTNLKRGNNYYAQPFPGSNWIYELYVDDLPVWGNMGVDSWWRPAAAAPNSSSQVYNTNNNSSRDYYYDSSSWRLGPSPIRIYQVYTILNLTIQYNNRQIVQVDLTQDGLVDVHQVENFTLHTIWSPTTDSFHSRFRRYYYSADSEQHDSIPFHEYFVPPFPWFPLMVSLLAMPMFMEILAWTLVCGNVATDSETIARDDHGLESGNKEPQEVEVNDTASTTSHAPLLAGRVVHKKDARHFDRWNRVRSEIFRPPSDLPIFAALISTGSQLVIWTGGVVLLGLFVVDDDKEPNGQYDSTVRQNYTLQVLVVMMVGYFFSTLVAGYRLGNFFNTFTTPTTAAAARSNADANNNHDGDTPVMELAMYLTWLLATLAQTSCFLNHVGYSYSIIPSWAFVTYLGTSVPLAITGTWIGRRLQATATADTASTTRGGAGGCRDPFPFCADTTMVRRTPPAENVVVPPTWYGKPTITVPLASLVSLACLSTELYYVVPTTTARLVDNQYKSPLERTPTFVYLFPGVFLSLVLVAGISSILVVYFCFKAKNYLDWQWTSFWTGASTCIYFVLYVMYYLCNQVLSGDEVLAVAFFPFFCCHVIHGGLMCGTIGYEAASLFVRILFQHVKMD